MVAVAEQFGNLRDTLGSVLGIFTMMRWIRTLIAKLTGRPPPVDATALTPAAFARFEGRSLPSGPDGAPGAPPRPSRKPLLFFILAAFGLPFLMSKVIKTLAASQEEEERRQLALLQQQQQQQELLQVDPSQLEFCRVTYDFTPPDQQQQVPGVDLAVKKGDLVAVLAKTDPLGNPSEWWRCRTRDGRSGYLPATFLEVARRPGTQQQILQAPSHPAPPSTISLDAATSRTNSLTSSSHIAGGAAPTPAPAPAPAPVLPESKVGDVSAESFQKSAFYS